MIEKTSFILDLLHVDASLRNYQSASQFGVLSKVKVSEKPTPAFVRLDAQVEIEKTKESIYQPK